MKKIIGILVIVMVFMLAGCEETEPKECEVGYDWDRMFEKCVPRDYNNDELYTQKEVDEMIIDIRQDLMQYYIQSYDGKLYTNCRIEDSIKVCDEIILDDYVTKAYLWADFYDSFGEDIVEYMEENYQPLENCDSDCEIDKIDREIDITTIAQIDLVLYGLEHSQEPLTDEEQFVFDLYTQLREQLYLEIGGE